MPALVYVIPVPDGVEECDCFAKNQQKCIPDIGILASADPVAIDMATFDLAAKCNQQSLAHHANPHLDPLIQLHHAERIGLGSLSYDLREIA